MKSLLRKLTLFFFNPLILWCYGWERMFFVKTTKKWIDPDTNKNYSVIDAIKICEERIINNRNSKSSGCQHSFEPYDSVGGKLYENCKFCPAKRIYENRFNSSGGIIR